MAENKVVLTQMEMQIAAMVGAMRRAESKTSGRPDNHGFSGAEAWDIDIEGAAAEMAFCKFRNSYWSASVGSFKEADSGKDRQIRQTKLENGCLIVRLEDNDDHYYVLVVGTAPEFRICGWIKGKDAKRDEFKKAPNGRPAAFFVPQNCLQRFKPQ